MALQTLIGMENIFIPVQIQKSCDDLVRRFNCKRPTAIQTSKVKFLPSEEVIRLTLEATISQRSAFGENPGLSKSIIPISRSTSSVSSAVMPKFPPSFLSRLVKDGCPQPSSTRNQKTSVVSKNSQGQAGDIFCEEQLFEAILHAGEVEGPGATLQKAMNQPCKVSSSGYCPNMLGAILPAKELEDLDTSKGMTMNKPLKGASSRLPNHILDAFFPAKVAQTTDTNKGKAMNNPYQGSSARHPANKLLAILPDKQVETCETNKEKAMNKPCKSSSPSCTVNIFGAILPVKKVQIQYANTEKAMNKPCQGSSSRHPPSTFGSGSKFQVAAEDATSNPEERELLEKLIFYRYYLPAKDSIWRAGEKIAKLALLLASQNSVMICNMDSVELLIFTSRRLHVDSKDVLRMAKSPCLLWGLFRRVKGGGVDYSNMETIGRDLAVVQGSSTTQAGSCRPRRVLRRLPQRYRDSE